MAERTPNVTKIISWFLEKKSLIKFSDDTKSYKLAENVIKANNFEKFPIKKGDVVEVGITADTITFLRKFKEQISKPAGKGSEEAYEESAKNDVVEEKPKVVAPAPKVEESKKPEVVGEEKLLTVFAVATNKKVVKFLEVKDAGWFQIDESIQKEDYYSIGLIAKNKVKVQIVENKVISLTKVASEPAEQDKTTPSSSDNAKTDPTPAQAPAQAPKKEWRPYSSNDNDGRQLSIEAQSSINAACDVVGRVAAALPQAPTASVVNNMIRAIAESNFALIQELKQKK